MINRYQLNSDEDLEEGFQHPPCEHQEIIIPTPQHEVFHSLQPNSLQKKAKYNSSEKQNLKLDAMQNTNINITSLSRHLNALSLVHTRLEPMQISRFEEEESRSLALKKSRRLERERSLSKFSEEAETVIFKTKRTQIGENLILKYDLQLQEQQIKEEIKRSAITYRLKPANSTHSYFKNLTQNHGSSFILSKYNSLIKQKIEKYKLKDEPEPFIGNDIQFKGDFESGNLDLAFKLSENEYNLHLRIDTHTKGHQSWFYFKVFNHSNHQRRIKINICNLKKKFKMIEKGQKLYAKVNGQWGLLKEQIQTTTIRKKLQKLSFNLTLQSQQQVYLSLIPPYTYSELLENIQQYESSPDLKVQTLTYSVSGLAIPLLTITKDAKREAKGYNQYKKKVYLISGRIHPSETCSSYIINGLIKELLSGQAEMEDFLSTSIIKIIPMSNPDGVVFGNFRTSYLGDDLNRSFHQSDEAIYPEVLALKQLVKSLKRQFQDNFLAFIDLHGHSCQTNSFAYGPQFQQDSEQFLECRIFPKILDKVSKYFSYEMSTFKLQQYKYNTARGFFLRKFKVPSYTIQTSYALFQDKNQDSATFKQMSIQQWSQLGKELALSLYIYAQYAFNAKKSVTGIVFKQKIKEKKVIETKKSIKSAFNIQSGSQISFMDVRKEIQKQLDQNTLKKRNESGSSDSDGDSIEQDLPQNQKEAIIKKVRQAVYPSFLFHRAMKPTMILPAIVPSITLTKKSYKNMNIAPKLSSKVRQKKFARPLAFSNEYTDYLIKNVNGLSSLKPDIINFSNLMKKKLKEAEQAEQNN